MQIEVTAIEKNPNALIVLNHFNKKIWEDKVKIICSDMRDIIFENEEAKADIIVRFSFFSIKN